MNTNLYEIIILSHEVEKSFNLSYESHDITLMRDTYSQGSTQEIKF